MSGLLALDKPRAARHDRRVANGGVIAADWLRRLVAEGRVVAPGVADPLTALAAERAGFETLFVSGAAVSLRLHGLPDLGFVSLEGMAAAVRAIAARVRVPLIVDADTGFGNAVHAAQAVRALAAAGAAAVVIEDQVFPKSCDRMADVALEPAADAVAKVRACAEAARESGVLLIARTDALGVEGLDAALARARAFAAAGADLLFVEAGADEAMLRTVAKALPRQRLVANTVDLGGGLTADPLFALGYAVALFPTAALRAQAAATEAVFAWLADKRELGNASWLADWADVNQMAGLDALLRAGVRAEER